MLDAVNSAETPTAAPAPHTRAPELIPRAVANACLRPWVMAARSTSAVSRPGITVSSPATTAKESTAAGNVTSCASTRQTQTEQFSPYACATSLHSREGIVLAGDGLQVPPPWTRSLHPLDTIAQQ